MKKLVNPNRIGGFPLTGEALEILAKDIPDYINAILEDIVPGNSIVFLNDRLAYYKRLQLVGSTTQPEIMEYSLMGITKAQILEGAHFVAQVADLSESDIVNGTTYSGTRTNVCLGIATSQSTNHPTAYSLDSLLRHLYSNEAEEEVDYINQITATSTSVDNIAVSGHAIIKGGYADISLLIEFTGSGTITVNFPDAFNCISGMLVLLYMNEISTDYNFIKGALRGCQLQFESVAGNIPRSLGLHLHYKPDEIQAL